jgi:hypothetical protein
MGRIAQSATCPFSIRWSDPGNPDRDLRLFAGPLVDLDVRAPRVGDKGDGDTLAIHGVGPVKPDGLGLKHLDEPRQSLGTLPACEKARKLGKAGFLPAIEPRPRVRIIAKHDP